MNAVTHFLAQIFLVTQSPTSKRSLLMNAVTHSAELADTRIGPITVWSNDERITRIELRARPDCDHAPTDERPAVLDSALSQLNEYLEGKRRRFDLPLELPRELTGFQRAVYEQLAEIGFGRTTTYGELAQEIGRPGSARAVGQAMAANPIPLILPCHRVVGFGGRLTGFGSGVSNKVKLLALEGVHATGEMPSSRVEHGAREVGGPAS